MKKAVAFFVLVLALDGCAAIPGYISCMRGCNSIKLREADLENELSKQALEKNNAIQLERLKREGDAELRVIQIKNEYLRLNQAKQLETAKLQASIDGESGIEVQKIKNAMLRAQNELDLETNRMKAELSGKTEAVVAENQGRAEYVRAQQNRKIKVLEREAEKEGAQLDAEAEVERAKGVAKANAIIGSSLKNNEAYLRWLWIHEVSSGEKPSTIYVPTEAGMPILEAGKRQ